MPSNKRQIKFYAPKPLEDLLTSESDETGQTVPSLVIEHLTNHYKREKKIPKKSPATLPRMGRPKKGK